MPERFTSALALKGGNMFEEIAREIHRAAADGQKIAMLHFQVLKHADQLATTDPKEFCRLVGVRESFATEFRKMLSLARLMEEQDVRLSASRR